MRAIQLCFFVMFLGVGGLHAAYAAAERAPDYPNERIYYYNGATRVELNLALDEFKATPPKAAARDLSAILPGASTRVTTAGDHAVTLAAPAANRADLRSKAATLSAAGFAVQAVTYSDSIKTRSEDKQQVLTRQLTFKTKADITLDSLLATYQLTLVEQVDYSPNTYIVAVQSSDPLAALETANAIYESGAVEFATPIIERRQEKKLIPNDPLFGNQWHLRNTGQGAGGSGTISGNDVNIVGAWDSVTGAGVNILIVDDGLETTHEDLSANVRTNIDIDINGGDADPSPETGDWHGTSVAGVAAAKGNNGLGVSGAAPDAKLIGVRLIGEAFSFADEAQALGHLVSPASAADRAWISNNSWGPSDNGAVVETFDPLTLASVENGATNGRGGRGVIYTWAGGNGRQNNDDAAYDGKASSRFTIGVAATGANGAQSYYSETGAGLLVNAPSSWSNAGITTTDRSPTGQGYNGSSNYTSSFSGTSSASPLVAGVVALMLDENPNLRWRDVQHILVETSTKNSAGHSDWQNNGAGHPFNHAFGFGRVNAGAAVSAASTWTFNIAPPAAPLLATEAVSTAIPDNNPGGINRALAISGPTGFLVEHVEVTVNITHTYRGELELVLTSPSGMDSVVARRRFFDSGDNISNFMFTSVAYFDEDPDGVWTLNVADTSGDTQGGGTLNGWSLRVHGYVPTTDNDGDGIDNSADGELDHDGDGLQDYEDTDSDNDTLLDADEGMDDVDNDTIPNYLDTDSDNDGFSDYFEHLLGTDPYNALDVPVVPAGNWMYLFIACAIVGVMRIRKGSVAAR